jgi:hypothetical protein
MRMLRHSKPNAPPVFRPRDGGSRVLHSEKCRSFRGIETHEADGPPNRRVRELVLMTRERPPSLQKRFTPPKARFRPAADSQPMNDVEQSRPAAPRPTRPEDIGHGGRYSRRQSLRAPRIPPAMTYQLPRAGSGQRRTDAKRLRTNSTHSATHCSSNNVAEKKVNSRRPRERGATSAPTKLGFGSNRIALAAACCHVLNAVVLTTGLPAKVTTNETANTSPSSPPCPLCSNGVARSVC